MHKASSRLRPLVLSLLVLAVANGSQASDTIEPGFDLYTTVPGSTFDFQGFAGLGLLDFEGTAIGAFDFGSGNEPIGDADTIFRRLAPASFASPIIPIEIVLMNLVSSSPIDIGNGPELIVISLNGTFGGTETINGLATEGAPHGTFDTSVEYFIDVRGTVSGFLGTINTSIFQSGAEWQHAANGDVQQLTGVNVQLNGSNGDGDIWGIEVLNFSHSGGGTLMLSPGTPSVDPVDPVVATPGLSNLGLMVLGLVLASTAFATRRHWHSSGI